MQRMFSARVPRRSIRRRLLRRGAEQRSTARGLLGRLLRRSDGPTPVMNRRRPSGTPMENYPIDDEAPTVPEPTAKTRRKRPAKKQTLTWIESSTGHTRCRAGTVEGGRSTETAHCGQRPHGGSHHRGAGPVQGQRLGHRLHPRPTVTALRGRARPRCQGRENHCATTQYRLRGGHRERPDAGADPRQVRSRHRGAQCRSGNGAAGRRADRSVDARRPPSAGDCAG